MVKYLSGVLFWGRLLALNTTIILGWKGLPGKNTCFYGVSFTLSATNKPFMQGVFILNVIMLNVVMLNVIMLSVVWLNVLAPLKGVTYVRRL